MQQFCLAIVQSSQPQVLFWPLVLHVQAGALSRDVVAVPLLELPAQHASINATLQGRLHRFTYDSPQSICGIPNAARNLGLLWGIYAAIFVSIVIILRLWPNHNRGSVNPRSCLKLKAVLSSHKVNFARRVATRVWFFVSDIVYSVYSIVTDAITIHQVFSSGQLRYAYLLLGILLLPTVFMLVAAARLAGCTCKAHIFPQTRLGTIGAWLFGILLSPVLLLLLGLAMLFQGIGIPLPAWFDLFSVNMFAFYRLLSCTESFLNALPQAVLQSKLYMMGNDPHGVHVYIDTRLFLSSAVGSLASVLKSFTVVTSELQRHEYGLVAYCVRLFQLRPLKKYQEFHSDAAGT